MNRENYLKKFHELKFESIRNGLGIGTRININLDEQYTKTGTMNYSSNKIIMGEDAIKELPQDIFIRTQHIIDNPTIENKIDYMHAALRVIKILTIEEDGEYIIERNITGNQYTHLIIHVKENINATIYINTSAENKKSNDNKNDVNNSDDKIGKTLIATEFLDIIIKENSVVHLIDLRNYGTDYFIYSRKKAHLGVNSNIHWTNIEGPAKLNITELYSAINGKNSGSIMNTLVLSKNSEYNIFTRTDHNAKDTKSLMQVRNIMNNSKAIMRGLVYIHEDATNSNGYQKTEMLMLDNTSRAISIPDLEIHNDDVKCTHGSSITRPDSEKIFYLQCRGLNSVDSEKLLIKGFYETLLSGVPNGLRDNVSGEIENILYHDIDELSDGEK
jgi:Fe-S cluster assembly scaffold protein SufB